VLRQRYELGARLGAGATGDVYDADDVRLHRRVAVKLLRAELGAEPEVRRRFGTEARAAARLAHPSIVRVFDAGEDDGRAFIVMERLSGRTLADEVADGHFDSARMRRLALELLGALDAAHRVGILHRDLKPSNVLLAAGGHWKLTDFGIAKVLDDADVTSTGVVVGTPAYLAPERHGGEPATARSDLWSLGVVLYEAATGERLFRGPSPVAAARAVLDDPIVPLTQRCPHLDGQLARVVDWALARDPASRVASAGDMRQALEDDPPLLATLPLVPSTSTTTMAVPPPTRPRRRSTGRRRGVAVLVAAALALALGGVALLGSGGSPTTAPPATTTPTTVSSGAPSVAPTTATTTTTTTTPPAHVPKGHDHAHGQDQGGDGNG